MSLMNVNGVALVSLLLTLNIFHTVFLLLPLLALNISICWLDKYHKKALIFPHFNYHWNLTGITEKMFIWEDY